jgi:ketosteroid isomerase-like protein
MSTKQIVDHHLQAFLAGDLDETMKDYTDASAFISPNGIAHGRDEIQAVFTRLYGGLFAPGSYAFTLDFEHTEGDVAFILWHADCAGAAIPIGTDTLVIRDGAIATQTVALKVEPKG